MNLLPRRNQTPHKPRSFKQHLMRRLIIVVPVFLLMFVLIKSGTVDVITDKLTFKPMSWFNNTALVEHLRIKITQNRLTPLPRHCLVFLVKGDESNNMPEMEVLGRYGGGNCPAKQDQPKDEHGKTKALVETLFHIKINRAQRLILTDAGSPGTFHPLSP